MNYYWLTIDDYGLDRWWIIIDELLLIVDWIGDELFWWIIDDCGLDRWWIIIDELLMIMDRIGDELLLMNYWWLWIG